MKFLMVCLGNICRSPIAEGIMKSKLAAANIQGKVDSAGVLSYHSGEAPDKRAISVAGKYQVDISGQVARQFRKSDFVDFDFILVMDRSVYAEIAALAQTEDERNKVRLFLEFAGINEITEVPDPYYGGQEGFEMVYNMLNEGCNRILFNLTK
ncbi:MAG: low molecular weight phosphotyrosine protein phosphatase [Bacteroidia bacterium]|nr:low molecular weight phosphotyrosine protein phosphatase [Bacteroidia bacterium]